MAITLPHDTAQRLRNSIKQFMAEEMDQDIGDLKADLLLDFCLKEVGAVAYNRGIADAQAFLQNRLADLDGVCYEPEFTYWQRHDDVRDRPRDRKRR